MTSIYFNDKGEKITEREFQALYGETYWPNTPDQAVHSHTLKRYVGLQKVVDYCDCGFEKDVPPDEIGPDTKT